MALIEHCEGKQKPEAIYRVLNFEGYQALFIFKGQCKAKGCKAVFYQYCYYDWDNQLHKRTPSDLFTANKSFKAEIQNLIESGIAVKIPKFELKEQKECRRGVPAGVGEWTLKARRKESYTYILRGLKLADRICKNGEIKSSEIQPSQDFKRSDGGVKNLPVRVWVCGPGSGQLTKSGDRRWASENRSLESARK